MAVLFGLKACDTCRKAAKALETNGISVEFRDVRTDPLSAEVIERFLATFGAELVNRRSTTWRGLNENTRAGDVKDLLSAHPALMKRPVIDRDGVLTLGWDKDVQAAHLG
jgi:Spx/MgsR family transcriptional regulator